MGEIDRLALILEIEAEGLLEVLECIFYRCTLTGHFDFKTARHEQLTFMSDGGREFHHASIRGRIHADHGLSTCLPGPQESRLYRYTFVYIF